MLQFSVLCNKILNDFDFWIRLNNFNTSVYISGFV